MAFNITIYRYRRLPLKLLEKGQNDVFDEFRPPRGGGRSDILEVLLVDRLYFTR